MQIKLSYKDVILNISEFSEISSRKECDTSVFFGANKFKMPIIPANMSCCIDLNSYINLINNGYFAILHRFSPKENRNTIDDVDFVEKNIAFMQSLPCVSISVGTGVQWEDLLKRCVIKKFKINYVTVDIAHGWSINMKNMVEFIKKLMPEVFIIGGNISCGEAAIDLKSWGCDAVKVGISMGKACSTYDQTGVGSPMFSAVLDVKQKSNIPIVADGQIRCGGDVMKALVAGASMVMVGSLFAACKDSPAPIVEGKKLYFGSASKRQKGNESFVEGKDVLLDLSSDDYLSFINKFSHKIQSGMSYLNRRSLINMEKCSWSMIVP